MTDVTLFSDEIDNMPLLHNRTHLIQRFVAILLCWQTLESSATEQAMKLHVPSPDWRAQIIYFVMLDRFADGDATNNNQGQNEYDANDNRKFNGGDLHGLKAQLDYVKKLGATAVWVTPPVRNQWWDGNIQYGGYHGYWASHFKEIDPHFGSLKDYQQLSDALHQRQMYLIQDIVVNHTGNFFDFTGRGHSITYKSNTHSIPVAAPTQYPFNLNNPNREGDKNANVYHWTPAITDFADQRQVWNHQLSSLDDLDTENPLVRQHLRDSYGHWIKQVGVDAFRVDTAFYVPPNFFEDFLHSTDEQAPGIMHVARKTGRKNFLLFGEGFGVDAPFQEEQAQRTEHYVRDPQARDNRTTRLHSMINFPLYGSLLDVFARSQPTAQLSHRINSMMRVHASPHLMPSFVDNHDVDRFLNSGDETALKQALLAIMTLPGIPTIYYGTEQGYREQRPPMFAAPKENAFNQQSALFRYLQNIIALRRAHPALWRGTPQIRHDNAQSAGALVWTMQDEQDSLLIVMNTAEQSALLNNVQTGLDSTQHWQAVFSFNTSTEQDSKFAAHNLTQVLPPRSAIVYRAIQKTIVTQHTANTKNDTTNSTISVDAPTLSAKNHLAQLNGKTVANTPVQLVINGLLQNDVSTRSDNNGHFRLPLRLDQFLNDTPVSIQAWLPQQHRGSGEQNLDVHPTWTTVLSVRDPSGDDKGPQQNYVYPTDSSWQGHRSLDIQQMDVSHFGSALQLDIYFADMVATWNPALGFDHLALNVFFMLPNAHDGAHDLPFQNAQMPPHLHWQRRLRITGWNAVLYDQKGASPTHDGRQLNSRVDVSVDKKLKRLRLRLPAQAFDNPVNLSGLRLYLNTWDYDGGYKPLTPQPGAHHFGGGNGSSAALWMDDSIVMTLP